MTGKEAIDMVLRGKAILIDEEYISKGYCIQTYVVYEDVRFTVVVSGDAKWLDEDPDSVEFLTN